MGAHGQRRGSLWRCSPSAGDRDPHEAAHPREGGCSSKKGSPWPPQSPEGPRLQVAMESLTTAWQQISLDAIKLQKQSSEKRKEELARAPMSHCSSPFCCLFTHFFRLETSSQPTSEKIFGCGIQLRIRFLQTGSSGLPPADILSPNSSCSL